MQGDKINAAYARLSRSAMLEVVEHALTSMKPSQMSRTENERRDSLCGEISQIMVRKNNRKTLPSTAAITTRNRAVSVAFVKLSGTRGQ